ncbi:MAG: enoyl-CoA hydratase/isomerase family protein [Candidatus Lokiarchaeota archaeon]|nr:enoyl-CoA hydratase/isomerase family protein [Candidatus Lokiarchaeota archaeon]
MGNKIELDIKENIATLKFIDPENLNPLNKESAKQLLEELESLRERTDVRCIIITGSGRAFSAGGDIKLFKSSIENGTTGKVMDDLTKDLYKIALILRLYPKPIIAAVNGWAVGAGMNLALSCDFIIASERARFRQSFAKLGLIPGFAGTILLSRQLTWQQATEMSFFGDTYSAEELAKLGLVNEIAPPEQLDEVTLQWAERLANGPTLAYARTKKLFFDALSTPLEEHLEHERQMQIKSAETEDYKRGVFALIDKKEPEFIGK